MENLAIVNFQPDNYLAQFVPHIFESVPGYKERFNILWKDYYACAGEPADPMRVFYLTHFLDIARQAQEGDYIELGSLLGFTARIIWRMMDQKQDLYCLDTFEGFKTPDLIEEKKLYNNDWHEGNFEVTSPNFVFKYITSPEVMVNWRNEMELRNSTAPVDNSLFPNLKIIKGWFPEAFSGYENKKWRFVHIDFDLYAPIKSALEILWPNVVKGGVVILHDYGCFGFPGVKKAVDEFFTPLGIVPFLIADRWGSVAVVKS